MMRRGGHIGTGLAMACLAGFLAGAPASAQRAGNSGLDLLERREKVLGWEAVGRLDIAEGGFCTATLIETRLVLTAAHCVHDEAGMPIAPSRITFRAGMTGDHAIATGRAARIVSHPGYDPAGRVSVRNVRHDLALVELAEPIPAAVAAPFPVQAPGQLRRVSVVSYARERSAALSWQRECGVTARGDGLMQFDCDVHFGSSGAPVFDRTGARARIVSVISSGHREAGRSVSYGMELPSLVREMKAQLRNGRNVISEGVPGASMRRIRVDTSTTPGRTEGPRPGAAPGATGARSGAKFMRP